MKQARPVWLALSVVALLGGCASPVKLDEPAPVETRKPVPVAPAPAQPASTISSVDLTAGAPKPVEATLGRIVYFDFDSFVVKDEFQALVEGHARVLAANKGKRMVVEGHTDERGGREYNLALGQKRAEAVTRALVLLGVGDGQLEAVSFGKERPAVQGSDEAAWAKNRRAEIVSR